MKKEYIAPESKLIVINLNEGIADVSGGISECPERKERRKRNWTL